MKIFFDSSINLDKSIVDFIAKLANEKEADFIATNYETQGSWQNEKLPKIRTIYSAAMSNIKAANLCIFDATIPSMRIGHELTYAIEKGRPTLLLVNESRQDVEKMFIAGSRSGYLTIKNYTTQNEIKVIFDNFYKKNTSKRKSRINLALDSHIMEYLEKTQYEKGLSKTSIIKSIIEKNMYDDKS